MTTAGEKSGNAAQTLSGVKTGFEFVAVVLFIWGMRLPLFHVQSGATPGIYFTLTALTL